MYCKNCGEQLTPEQKFCANCGASTTTVANDDPKPTDPLGQAKQHKPQIVKISILTLCVQFFSLLLVVTFLFLPIFTCIPERIENVQDWEEFVEIIESEGELDFSLFDEIKLILGALFPNEDQKEQNNYEGFFSDSFSILFGMYPLMEIFMIAILLISFGSIVYEQANNLRNTEDFALLRYNEIKKSGTSHVKPTFWQKQSAFSLITFTLFDILFTRIFSRLFGDYESHGFYRHMLDFSSFSPYVYIVATILVVIIILKNITKKLENDLRLSIIRE